MAVTSESFKMEDDNVHTSIVIQMGKQEKSEDKERLPIHFKDGNPPQNYFIDQIFCEDNVTVYALLEISDVANRLSDKQLVEVKSAGFKDDFRFYHDNSFNDAVDKKNLSKNKFCLKMKKSEKKMDLHSHLINRKKSFYCLKHFENRFKIPLREEDNSDMKVLYTKDMSPKKQNFIKLKSVSKGVNTDIAQSPKLLETIKEAISVEYPSLKKPHKTLRFNSTIKTPNELVEMDENSSNSTVRSEGDHTKQGKQSSSNFMLVPLIMMQEGILNQFLQDNRNLKLPEKKTLSCYVEAKPTNVAIGTNTDFNSFESITQEEFKKNNSNKFEKILMIDKSTEASDEIKKERCCKANVTDVENKETILEEIRNLQNQMHALIKSLERRGADIYETIHAKSQENTTTTAATSSKSDTAGEVTETESKENPDLLVVKPNVNLDKFYDGVTDIMSPHCPSSQNQESKKNFDVKKIQPIHLSKSSTVTSSTFNTSSLKSILENEKENYDVELNLKEELEFFGSEKESFSRKWKGVYLSKSDFSCRYTFSELKYFSCQVIKKSQSLDQRIEKPELLSVKKLKNISLKQEGILKGKNNSRLHQPMENPLLDNLTPLKCEMGDEVATKCKVFTSPEINVYPAEKDSSKDFVKNVMKPENFNEEEGDAKLGNQKHRLAIPKYVHKNERITAQFCSTHTDSPVKQYKNIFEVKTKDRKDTSIESNLKISKEKTSFLKTVQKKINNTDGENRKDTSSYKNCRKVSERLLKCEKKDLKEITKQKSVIGSRKSLIGNSPYSKLHVNKLIKNEAAFEVRADLSAGSNSYKSSVQGRKLQEKQYGGKNAETFLSYAVYPRSNSRFAATSTPPSGNKEKEISCSSSKNSKSSFDENNRKWSRETVAHEQMSEEILDSDKKLENIFLADNYSSPKTSKMSDSSQSSSVVLEVLSKKPDSEDDLYFELVNEEFKNITSDENNVLTEISPTKSDCETIDKPVVKSVWALTKVLLFEDGTKKFEVLEASLTPPGYLIKDEKSSVDKSR